VSVISRDFACVSSNRRLLFFILFRRAGYTCAYRPFIRCGYRASTSLNLKAKAESNRQPYLQANWPIANMRRIACRSRLKNPPEDRVRGARVFALVPLDFPCQSTKSAHSHVSARYLKALTVFDNATFLLLLQTAPGYLFNYVIMSPTRTHTHT